MAFIKNKIKKRKDRIKHSFILLFPILAVIILALVLTYLTIIVDLPKVHIVPFLEESELQILMNVMFFACIFSISVPLICVLLKKGLAHWIEKIFAMAGGTLTLIFCGSLNIYLFQKYQTFLVFIIVWICTFFIALSILFSVLELFSERVTNNLSLIYCSIAGSFLGLGIPLLSMVIILGVLPILDVIFYRLGVLTKIINLAEGTSIFISLKHRNSELIVGVGDLIYYAMLTSYSLVHFGVLTSFISSLLILLGVVFTIFWATEKKALPGLLLPFTMGLIPLIFHLS